VVQHPNEGRVTGAMAWRIWEDLDAFLAHDPAARNRWEVFFLYPGFHALLAHRINHILWRAGLRFFARAFSQIVRLLSGIEIHPGAKIGRRVVMDHGMGIVIGETAEIGDDCVLYQGVTLGGTGKEKGKRHPTLGRGVLVGAGAKILGAITIGDYAKIGAGAVVLRDVPPNATVVGVPGRAIVRRPVDPAYRPVHALDHGDLPDPCLEEVALLEAKLANLLHELRRLDAVSEALELVLRDRKDQPPQSIPSRKT